MDQPQELFKDAMARMRGSFFSSFVFAWTIANWQAVYVTLFVTEKFLPFSGNKRFPDKLSYLGWLYGHDYWWVLSWLLCLLSAFFMPLILHSLNRRIRHQKLVISHNWNEADAVRAKAKVVPQEAYDQVFKERNDFERQYHEASEKFSHSQMALNATMMARVALETEKAAWPSIQGQAKLYKNFVDSAPGLTKTLDNIKEQLGESQEIPCQHIRARVDDIKQELERLRTLDIRGEASIGS